MFNSGGLFVTSTCDLWSAATLNFSPTFPLPVLQGGRAGHAATLLPNGQVLVTGGVDSNVLDFCASYLGLGWATTGPLFFSQAYHKQALLPNGRAYLCGGTFSGGGSAVFVGFIAPYAGTHTGVFHFDGARIGTNPANPTAPQVPLVWRTLTDLHDGSFLIAGGTSFELINGTATAVNQAQAWIYVP